MRLLLPFLVLGVLLLTAPGCKNDDDNGEELLLILTWDDPTIDLSLSVRTPDNIIYGSLGSTISTTEVQYGESNTTNRIGTEGIGWRVPAMDGDYTIIVGNGSFFASDYRLQLVSKDSDLSTTGSVTSFGSEDTMFTKTGNSLSL